MRCRQGRAVFRNEHIVSQTLKRLPASNGVLYALGRAALPRTVDFTFMPSIEGESAPHQGAANRNSCARLSCSHGLQTLYPVIKPTTLRAHLNQAYGLRHNGAVNGFFISRNQTDKALAGS